MEDFTLNQTFESYKHVSTSVESTISIPTSED